MRLGEICDLNKFNKQISAKEIENMNVGKGSVKLLPSSKNYDWWTDEITAQNYINEGEVIALGVARYANIKKHKGKFVSANNKLLSIKEKVKEEILFDYVYFLLEIYAQKLYKSGSQYPQFDTNKFDSFLIPKPKMEIQSQIVSECEEVEKQFNTIKMSIEEYKNLIKAILVKTGICEDYTNGGGAFELDFATILATLTTTLLSLQGDNSPKQSTNEANLNALKALLSSLSVPPKEGWEQYRLSDTKIFKLQIGKRVLDSELTTQGKIPVYSANVKKPFGYINKEILKDYENDSVLWGIDGDWLVSFMPKNTPFYPTDHCGVLQVNNDAIKPKILSFILDETGKKRRFDRNLRASIERIQALKLAIPPLKEQEKIVSAIEYIENEMTDLAKRLDILESQKSKILEKYL